MDENIENNEIKDQRRAERRSKRERRSSSTNTTSTEEIDIKTLQKELKKAQRELKRERMAVKASEALEKEMKIQRQQLDDVIDVHMVYVRTNKELIIEEVSRAFLEMFEFTPKEIIGSNLKELVAYENIEKFYNGCEYVSSHGSEGWGTDLRMLTKENQDRFTHTFIYPSFTAGSLTGFIFVLQDISTKLLLQKLQVKLIETEKHNANTLDYVSSTSAAVLDTVSKGVSTVVKIIVTFIFLFLVYAVSFDIDEIAKGDGKFIPTSKIQHLKNQEGGTISAIYVREGDSVKKGQILAKLSPISYQSKLDENIINIKSLKAKEARLNAEANDLPMDNITCQGGCEEKFLRIERNYYLSNQKELQKNISKQLEQLNSQQSILVDSKNKLAVLQENIKTQQEEYNMKKRLVKRKIIPKFELAKLARDLNDMKGQIKSAQEMVVQTNAKIQEIKNSIEESKLTFRNKAAAALNDTISQILTLEETNKNLKDIIKRTVVRSPVDGVVKELFVHTIGASIQPSTDIMTIVPQNYEMIAEVKVKPADIAKLHIGQNVVLKVTAFDYSIYGDLKGKIINISPDTITDKDTGESHYLIYVKTKKNYLNNNPKYKIKVGMMVNADILVGKKSIMSYLLKPILKTTQRR